MPGDIELCGFTLTEDEWRALDEETRELVATDWVDAYPYESYEVMLEPIAGLA